MKQVFQMKIYRTIGTMILAAALLVSMIFEILPVHSGGTDDVVSCTIKYSKPAICCDVGDRIDLTQCSVQFYPDAPMTRSGISWTYKGKTVKVVNVSKRGVYELTAKSGGAEKTVYVVAKSPEEAEYVLYRNDFDSAPTDFRIVESTNGAAISCDGGNYILDASVNKNAYIRVLLPAFLDVFGDAKITASMKFVASVDNNKWASLMFRVQDGNYPYYQGCLRRNAKAENGMEISLKNAQSVWEVHRKTAFGYAESSEYNLCSVTVKGTQSVFSVNGYEALAYSATSFANGGFGVQTRGSKLLVDYIQISLDGNDPDTKSCDVSFAKPAIRADMGDTIDLTSCDVQMTVDSVYTNGNDITWKKDGKVISSFTPVEDGVTMLTATAAGVTKKVYVVTRNLTDGEYVIYQNNFDKAPTDFRVIEALNASAYHDGAGNYVLDASASDSSCSRVLLPSFLDDFGKFKIEAGVRELSSNTERNWSALMANVQNVDYPYIQFCVRNNSALSDGVEITERSAQNKWVVKAKDSYDDKLADSRNIFALSVENNCVRGYINGDEVINFDSTSHTTGAMGFQAKGLKMSLDYVKVTLGDDPAWADTAVRCVVSKSKPAIGCNAGQTIQLSRCAVQFTYGSYPVDGSQIIWKHDGKIITEFSNTSVGTHKLTATHGHTTMDVYVIAKKSTAKEYVLYYNDFSTGPTDYRVPEASGGGKVYPINGTFVLDGSAGSNAYVRVLLPQYLDQFGDADFEAKIKLSSAVDSGKWGAIMYRTQNAQVPYLQCCWRYDSSQSSGVEIAQRTADGKWNVLENTSTTVHNKGQYNVIQLSSSDLETTFSINGSQLIYISNTPYYNGSWGFHVRGLTMTVDEVKLSFTSNETAMSIYTIPGGYVDVRDVSTGITAPPAMVTEVKTRADFDNILTDCPAVAIMRFDVVDGVEKIVFEDGAVNPNEALNKLGSKVIPAFRIDDALDADRLASFLKGRNQRDAYAVSTELSVLKRAYDNWKYIRGVADYSQVTVLNAETLRYDALKNGARVLILPESASRTDITYLQDSFSCVWLRVSEGKTATVAATNKGPYGLITPERSVTQYCYQNYYGNQTLIRRTNVIGHRGNPSQAPENTIYGTNLAYSNGANGVETDIYLSADHVVIVMHDETLDRTTNGTGKVVELSSAQIKKYVVDYYSGVASQPIPTLDDYFKAIRSNPDRKLVIEMKHPADASLAEALAKLIQAYDIMDQVVCISFLHNNLHYIRKNLPGVPAGLLTWLTLDETNPVYSVYETIENVQGGNYVCNPGYSGWGDAVIRELVYRGITLWPWTLNDQTKFDGLMMDGVAGITTDYPQWSKSYIESIHWNSASRVISSTYNDVLTDVTNSCEVVVVEDTLGLICSAGNITVPDNPNGGKASFYYRYKSVSPKGTAYYTVTEIRTIEVAAATVFALRGDSALKLEGGILTNVRSQCTVAQLKAQFVDPVSVKDRAGKALGDNDVVTTGSVVFLDRDPAQSAVIVVCGDVNGDGSVNSTDSQLIRTYFLEETSFSGVYFLAADCDSDGQITMTDYVRVRASYLSGFDLLS